MVPKYSSALNKNCCYRVIFYFRQTVHAAFLFPDIHVRGGYGRSGAVQKDA